MHCDRHGTIKATSIFWGGEWHDSGCKACSDEREAERRRIEEESYLARAQAYRQSQVQRRLKQNGIPPRFQGKSFETYAPQNDRAAAIAGKCRVYAEKFPEYATAGTGMILCGLAGTGKTHLACAIADHLITKGRAVGFMQVAQAIRNVKSTYSRDAEQTEQEALAAFKLPDLLILDEVGVQFGSDAERMILFEIINSRYEEMKPTILLSNLALDGLVKFVGERIIDRMKENGGMMLVFDWPSHRGSQSEVQGRQAAG